MVAATDPAEDLLENPVFSVLREYSTFVSIETLAAGVSLLTEQAPDEFLMVRAVLGQESPQGSQFSDDWELDVEAFQQGQCRRHSVTSAAALRPDGRA
ncbi:MAG TPA: hypothetical protein VJQ46_16095 [Gemmatimonadales bacterium]|nr:hypothetical protein [Gemmatimonadales bacterium]